MSTKKRFLMEKLGRDNIEYFKNLGINAHVKFLSGEELILALKNKLIEESQEVLFTTKKDELIDELADVQEVILTIMSIVGIKPEDVEAKRKTKKDLKGGFEKGIYYHYADISSDIPDIQDYFLNNPDKYPEMKE